jgi:monoamine oxidase
LFRRRWDVVVVGAGAAGLAAAEALSRGGASVVVVEARARAGGRVFTRRARGWPLPIELGAEFVHGRNEKLFALARRAALLIDRLPDATFQVTGSGWKRMRGLWEKLDAITRRMGRDGPDRSVEDFLRSQRSLSREQKRLARSIVDGYHAAFPDRTSEHALSTAGDPPLETDERLQFRVVSGYDGVIDWLRSRLDTGRCRLLFSTPVAEIRWRRGEVRVRTAGNGPGELRARRAVVTVPVGVLKSDPGESGGIRIDPDPPTLRRALARLEMGHVVKIVLRFRDAFWENDPARKPTDGEPMTFLHNWGAEYPTWWTAAPAEVPMLTGWAGGPEAAGLLRLPRAQRLGRSLQTLASLFEIRTGKLRRLLVGWHTHDWSADPYSRGAYSYVGVGGANAPAALARPIDDTLYFAGEATEPDESGTVPGAIASGRRVARLILSAR